MPGSRTVQFDDETEFGGGSGMIDPQRRADRVIGSAAGGLGAPVGAGEELWEIYATNPADPTSAPETAVIERP